MRSPDLRRCLYNVPLSLAALEKPRMSIKSDRWIRRMAEQHGMVEPFESGQVRSEEHTSELQSLMRISYAVFCLKKKKKNKTPNKTIRELSTAVHLKNMQDKEH